MQRTPSSFPSLRRPVILLFAVMLCCLPPAKESSAATLPQAASAAGREMDRQIMSRLGQSRTSAGGISLCITTPVDNDTLETSNALARQMQEEIARWFVQAGYTVQEIRKGADLLFEPATGEMLLTRKDRLLGSRKVTSTAIVVGTYTVTPQNVRFNISLVRAGNREILAMSTITVPMNSEVAALVRSGSAAGHEGGLTGIPIEPTVVTLLP